MRRIVSSSIVVPILAVATLGHPGSQINAASFTVTNTNDSGLGSLRQAIIDANANVGTDTIDFDIPGAGPHTIQPLLALPTITDPVVLDGNSQPGFAGSPIIELDGSSAGVGVHGLHITAGNSRVRALVINRFDGDGILLETSEGNVVSGNFIGTDVTGTTASEPAGPVPPAFTVTAEPETSATWPVGTDFDGFISQSDDPVAPWSGTSVQFRGTNEGGSTETLGDASLVYRYRLEFAAEATLTAVTVSGAAFNGGDRILRVLDENMNVVGSVDTSDGVGTTVQGMLNSAPLTEFRLEFFTDAACDHSGFGEGRDPIANVDVTTDASGKAMFAFGGAFSIGGQFITVTATDPGGNTSEFSECVQVESTGEVHIDIKPGSDPNSINLRGKGKIPVAILSDPDFDAPSEADRDSLTFGRT